MMWFDVKDIIVRRVETTSSFTDVRGANYMILETSWLCSLPTNALAPRHVHILTAVVLTRDAGNLVINTWRGGGVAWRGAISGGAIAAARQVAARRAAA